MLEDITEEIVTGYCKSTNQNRLLTCEFKEEEQGRRLEYADCKFLKCPHHENCELIKQAMTYASEKGSGKNE